MAPLQFAHTLLLLGFFIAMDTPQTSGQHLHCQIPDSTAMFSCTNASGTLLVEDNKVRWKRLDKDEWLEDRGRVYLTNMGRQVMLAGVQTNDSGVYEAWLWNKKPKLLCTHRLWVSPDGECRAKLKLRASHGKRKLVTSVGGTVCLKTRLVVLKPSYVPFDLEMLFLHFNLSAAAQLNLVDNDRVRGARTLSLCINNASIYDSGTYSVHAVRLDGHGPGVKRKLRIVVRENATIIVPPQSVDVRLSAPATLTCIAKGNPVPSIVWFKNDVALGAAGAVEGQNLTITSSHSKRQFQRTSQLSLLHMSPDLTGSYRCQASNQMKGSGSVASAQAFVHLLKRTQPGSGAGIREDLLRSSKNSKLE